MLYSFNSGGSSPAGGVIMNRAGGLYGLAGGGTNQNGIAYELTAPFPCGARCPSIQP